VSVFFIKIKSVTPQIKYKKAQELNSKAAGPQTNTRVVTGNIEHQYE
jgi:hypothetical protein